MSNPIDSVEIATDIASTAFENDEYNQDGKHMQSM